MAFITIAGISAWANIADRSRDKNGNTKNAATLKMKPRKLSKQTAKLRKNSAKERKKQMADIKKSNQQRNRHIKKSN